MVGERIKEARQRAGLTQTQLSEAAYVSKSTLSQYERGLRVPELSLLERIADILQISPAELAGWAPHLTTPKDDRDYLARLLRENDDNVSLTLEQLQGALIDTDKHLRVLTAQLNKAFSTLSFAIHSIDIDAE